MGRVERGYSKGVFYLFAIQSVFWLATSVVTPFLSIFLIDEYTGVGLAEVGTANLIFFLAFGLFLPIVSKIEDRIAGLGDELEFLNVGLFARGILFILMSVLDGIWALYTIHLFLGLSRAFFSQSYRSLLLKFSSLDKKVGTTYVFSLDEGLVNILAALGSGLGGYLVVTFGARALIFVVGICFLISMFFTIPLRGLLYEKQFLTKEMTEESVN